MGLDVKHVVLVHQPVDQSDYWTIEDWDSFCNVPLDVYTPYITDVQEYDFNRSIAFLETEAEAQALVKTGTYGSYEKIYIGLPRDSILAEIAHYIAQQNLAGLERIDMTVSDDSISYYTVSFGEPITKKGFYFQEIAAQRNGMNSHFYDVFQQYDLWGRYADFELAHQNINTAWYTKHYDNAHAAEVQRKFKADFLDTFQFGRSLLEVSF